jgi:hypothetical protein
VTISYTLPDSTAPTASPSQSPTANAAGWNNNDVTVTWNWTDNPGGSGIDPNHCTGSSTSSGEGANLTLSATCLDLAGNVGSASYTVKVDKTSPTITASLTPANPAGTRWYNQSTGAPTVSFNCSDALSGLQGSCPGASTFPEGADQSHTASISDNAGNSASAGVSGINVDLTPPTVSYSGNAGSYTVDQQVQIACTPSDALSGVPPGSSTCQTISGPAYRFGLGTQSYRATATDAAGNSGSGSTSFTVTVTPSSLQALVNRFCTDPAVAASLDQDVDKITRALNANEKAAALHAFTQRVQAQTGKSLTSDQASVLITLASAL